MTQRSIEQRVGNAGITTRLGQLYDQARGQGTIADLVTGRVRTLREQDQRALQTYTSVQFIDALLPLVNDGNLISPTFRNNVQTIRRLWNDVYPAKWFGLLDAFYSYPLPSSQDTTGPNEEQLLSLFSLTFTFDELWTKGLEVQIDLLGKPEFSRIATKRIMGALSRKVNDEDVRKSLLASDGETYDSKLATQMNQQLEPLVQNPKLGIANDVSCIRIALTADGEEEDIPLTDLLTVLEVEYLPNIGWRATTELARRLTRNDKATISALTDRIVSIPVDNQSEPFWRYLALGVAHDTYQNFDLVGPVAARLTQATDAVDPHIAGWMARALYELVSTIHNDQTITGLDQPTALACAGRLLRAIPQITGVDAEFHRQDIQRLLDILGRKFPGTKVILRTSF